MVKDASRTASAKASNSVKVRRGILLLVCVKRQRPRNQILIEGATGRNYVDNGFLSDTLGRTLPSLSIVDSRTGCQFPKYLAPKGPVSPELPDLATPPLDAHPEPRP